MAQSAEVISHWHQSVDGLSTSLPIVCDGQ
jgi:hypothetical protein